MWTFVIVKCAPSYPQKTPVLTEDTQTCKGKRTASWMHAMSCSTSTTNTKTCYKIVILYSLRNVTEVLLDRQCSLFSLLEPECKDLLGKFVYQRIMICGNWIFSIQNKAISRICKQSVWRRTHNNTHAWFWGLPTQCCKSDCETSHGKGKTGWEVKGVYRP